MTAPPGWSLERGLLVTEAYRKYESEAAVVKRAHAMAHLLDNKRILIQDGELIVGNFASDVAKYELFPEYTFQDTVVRYTHFVWDKEIDESDFATEEEKHAYRQMREFWRGTSMHDIADAVMPEFIQKLRDTPEICGNAYGRDEGQGHIVVEYDVAVHKGFRWLIDKARERLDEVAALDPKAYDFLRAIIITSEAVIRFAHRLADEAERLAAQENDPARKAELEGIAANCRRVPEYPAETFQQGCQTAWLVHMLVHLEQGSFSISLGRFDQYMYPLYKGDIEAGRLTKAQALEIIECLFVKCMEITIGGVKVSLTQTITLCGSDKHGKDMTNELSYLCIKADRETQMVQPSLLVRWHENIDQGIIAEVLDTTWKGDASIAIINDDAYVPGLIDLGIAEEDAYNYAQSGCNETTISGKLIGGGVARPIFLIRVIELAMHGGYFPPTEEQIGPRTKKLGEFESFDDFLEAYRIQITFLARYTSMAINIMDNLHADHAPLPFTSSLMHGTIKRGRGIMVATDYFHPVLGHSDVIAAVNCLASIKKAVFEDHSVTQEELKEALAANFEGYESVRKKLWDAPKFGNDDDYVDDLVPIVEKLSMDAMEPYRSFRNNSRWILECIPRISHVYEGLETGATPDGRRAGESFPAGIAAQCGTDVNGPTALLNSMTKINTRLWCGGVIGNIRWHPNVLRDESSREKARILVNVYFKKGGSHLQMNCVRKELLLDAKKNPQNYRDLMVRVSGYVDYFTNLDEASQDDIIARTVHAG